MYGAGDIYRCPVKDGCPGTVIATRSIEVARWKENPESASTRQCSIGYDGPICGSCVEGYNHIKVGKPCDSCDDGVINVPLVLGVVAMAAVVASIVLSGLKAKLEDNAILTDIRLIIGFHQILGGMSTALDIQFPSPVPELISFVKLLFLDLRALVRMDCWDLGGFYGKVVTNIVAMPIMVLLVCILMFYNQRRTITAVISAGAADKSALRSAHVQFSNNVMLGIFLLYPTIATTLFRVPQCRSLGEQSFHEEVRGFKHSLT